jgi:hypothetical protein
MTKQELQQNIAKYFVKLPKEAQDVFASMTWLDILKRIESNYKLDEEQVETLGTETTLILLGITHLTEYKEIINTEMNLDKETARKIFEEIDINILRTIKDQVALSFEKNALDLAEEKYGGEKSLKERFGDLPEKIKKVINESNYQSTIYEIADSYGLNVEQIGLLEEITTKVLLRIIPLDKYEEELITNIKTEKENILKISDEINKKVFKEIEVLLQSNLKTNSTNTPVPLPPYKKESPVIDKLEIPIPPTINNVGDNHLEEEEHRILSDSGIDIIGSKLSNSTVSAPKVSDYSLPKMGQSITNENNNGDKYREEI